MILLRRSLSSMFTGKPFVVGVVSLVLVMGATVASPGESARAVRRGVNEDDIVRSVSQPSMPSSGKFLNSCS